ncbi:MAG: osmoprotectant transport system permease protein [Actinomycetota bacterium]|jgi:osmoprotectant transport system permease protein|nr:osmoprotectant transport system permease protein [Actinomycetota bacterium]
MDIVRDAFAFLTDGANWAGSSGIPTRLWEHVQMSLIATGLALIVALPVGLAIGHSRKGEFLASSVGNIGRALPSFGVLGLVFPFTLRYLPGSIGFAATLIALFLLAIPPILINTYVGVQGVDEDTLEAARGMGMDWRQVLVTLEVPLALPLIVAGVRNAAVAVVATATLGAVVAWGGLGRFIIDGFATGDHGQILAGAFLVACLAVVTELGIAAMGRALSPRGLEPRSLLPGEDLVLDVGIEAS